jgi:D-tyrosyl-tRNA(Tyr) deacylase
MRAVIQRVRSASVTANGQSAGSIGPGLLIYLGIGRGDKEADADYVARKIAHLRIFRDAHGKMNRSVVEEAGEILLVSQFTLYGDVRQGHRPAFEQAESPAEARRLYERTAAALSSLGLRVATGIFQADMEVTSVNSGPVTILIDSTKLF